MNSGIYRMLNEQKLDMERIYLHEVTVTIVVIMDYGQAGSCSKSCTRSSPFTNSCQLTSHTLAVLIGISASLGIASTRVCLNWGVTPKNHLYHARDNQVFGTQINIGACLRPI